MALPTYGKPTPAMEALVAEVVRGRHVFDFGAGSCELSRWLLRRGAKHVTAIDSSLLAPRRLSKRVTTVRGYFADQTWPDRIDVGFVSWPSNRPMQGLVDALRRCDKVVYLGCNDMGTMCGSPDLFPYLLTRRLDAYVHDRTQRMVVVGEPLPDGLFRKPTEDEANGMAAWLMP